MGKGLVDQLKKHYAIEEQWLPFEIHPETPPTGVLWEDYFPGMDARAFLAQLDERGRELGVRFNEQMLMSNSRLALEGGEFAKEQGSFLEYHAGVFKAYFTECRDIGDSEVLHAIAADAGLDVAGFEEALESGRYRENLKRTTQRARQGGVTGVPHFVVNGMERISGAVPVETFREVFGRISQRGR